MMLSRICYNISRNIINKTMKHFLVQTTRPALPSLIYESALDLQEGDIVIVPLQNQNIIGVVLGEQETMDYSYNIKQILYKFPEIQINKCLIKFIQKFAKYYMIDESSIFKMVIPIKITAKSAARNIYHDFEYKLPCLSVAQTKVLEEIQESSKVCLIHGVTGSGKTEIYFYAIAETLKRGEQALLMLPEIGLVGQIVERFEGVFGISPSLWHSSVTPAKKRDIFYGVINGSCRIVIGTRSSIFLPFQNLKLIVIDEEHDGSYKQEEGGLYNARDAAILRGNICNAKVVLVSATPSIETYANVQEGKYHRFHLRERYGASELPEVQIIDMKKEERGNWISRPLREAIAHALECGMQVILFINRKGYAPLILCSSCGFRFTCINCSSWLVYHKEHSSLMCHHCGYKILYPKECPECSNETLVPCGPGVERVYDEAREIFSGARIGKFVREDSEINNSESIVEQIIKREIDIIIGTQILTKGYHFPFVTVVGIIDADTGIANIDLKANERLFQLLNQVSGRAGRSLDKGQSFVQTYYPSHEIFSYIKSGDDEVFYEAESKKRRLEFLPPVSRIISIMVSGDSEIEALNLAKQLRNFAPKIDRVKILGPAPATMSKLRGKYRFRILLISDKSYNLQHYAKNITSHFNQSRSLWIRLEVDPQSFY